MTTLDLTDIHPVLGVDPTSGHKESKSYRINARSTVDSTNPGQADEIVIDNRRLEFAGRQTVNDKVNMVARTIRIVDQTMTQIEENLQQMKQRLVEFRKLYPPFPPGSEERLEMIQQFNLLRRQIDALTFPSESVEAAQIMTDPDQLPEEGGLQVSIGGNGEELHIRPQPVHTGATGLDVPEIPPIAGDAEIDAVIARLDQAQQTLTHRRKGLAMDVRQQIV